MTDQEKISRLASAATESPSSFPSNPSPIVVGPPFAIRKTLCSDCHASEMPLPFFPRVAFYQEARVMLGDRKTGPNHRRLRPHQRPTLAAASCCLMCSLSALFVTSPRGEESLTAVARNVIQASSDAGMMVSNSAP
ncbi:hypothetical protein [Luteolibacter soli]|uniref:Uncharacterized protein n=1 Tax=Luteolibacter soli TaxID=3135280 RepID=A0ABU9AQU4_9BACT